MTLYSLADKVIEAPVVTSFTRIGYDLRRLMGDWRDPGTYRMAGRVVAITGPTSGLGLAAAEVLTAVGASVILIARDERKASELRARLATETGNEEISVLICDMADMDAVRAAARTIDAEYDRLDVLIHNAGSLLKERRTAPGGVELTTAVQVVGPFLMTGLLLDKLAATPDARVLTMSSGGMYTAGLTVSKLQMDPESYRGAEQYARAKRAQVTLNEMWAERTAGSGIRFHALHPGWADTPGVAESLPRFRMLLGPLLRSPAQGADTLVWLAADDGIPLASSGGFWLDRRPRSIHRLRSTRRTDTPQRRSELWNWVSHAADWELPRPGDAESPFILEIRATAIRYSK